jgi:GTPase SAR1 family protein
MANKVDSNGNPKNCFNILLLGETGVGKSTFINAFINYVTYPTMKEAKNEGLMCLIPVKFTIANDNYEIKEVSFGESSPDEQFVDSQSATQCCRSYTFPFQDITLKLFDTPGVGDTRGVDRDKFNFQNILQFIGKYEELHAIVLLLKPNNARLNIFFEYCIKQLMYHLDKTAAKNIIFLFTNTRQTFYRPGDTIIPLRSMLDQIKCNPPYVDIQLNRDNIFCVDNEAFRFLVAIRNGVEFSDDEKDNYNKSWNHSAKEYNRLIQKVTSEEKPMVPHPIQNTITINEARRLIQNLINPMAEIPGIIQRNLMLLSQHEAQLNGITDDIERIKENLYVPMVEVKYRALSYPILLCNGPQCQETIKFRKKDLNNEYYDFSSCYNWKTCQEPCFPNESFDDPKVNEIKNCDVIDKETELCKKCQCSYKLHMRQYYKSDLVIKTGVDDEKRREIEELEDKQERYKTYIINALQDHCERLNKELEFITMCSAKFSHYLAHNALVPYDDSFKSYLEHIIENEKFKKCAENQQMIEGLEKIIEEYEKEKKLLVDAQKMDEELPSVSTQDIMDLIVELQNLSFCGPMISQAQKAQEETKIAEINANWEVIFYPKITKFLRSPVRIAKNFFEKLWNN